MSAARHIADALDEAMRLDADVDALIQAHRTGKVIGFDDLAHIRRMTTVIRTHAAMAHGDLARMPQLERRDEPRIAITPAMPTLPQLLAPAQKALDDYHDQGIGGEAAVSMTFRSQS